MISLVAKSPHKWLALGSRAVPPARQPRGLGLGREGQVQVLIAAAVFVAAAESAIGLAILVVYHRVRNTIAVDKIQVLCG